MLDTNFMTPIEVAIMRLLQRHIGPTRAIGAPELRDRLAFEHLNIGLPEMRGVIHDLRQKGALIGSSQLGYWLPSNLLEAFEYIDQVFRVPARDQLVTARKQREFARQQFSGQLRLI